MFSISHETKKGHMPVLYPVILFDLDGTLLDSAIDIVNACNEVVTKYGYTPLPLENIGPLISHGSRGVIAQIINEPETSKHVMRLRDEVLQKYAAGGYPNTRVFPSLLPTVKKINQSNCLWGIVTSKPKRHSLDILHKYADITTYAVLVTLDDVTDIKPSPEGLYVAMKALDVTPQQCVYVGDNRVDMLAAARAGMDSIGVGYGYCTAQENPINYDPTYYAHTPQDLANILQCLCGL